MTTWSPTRLNGTSPDWTSPPRLHGNEPSSSTGRNNATPLDAPRKRDSRDNAGRKPVRHRPENILTGIKSQLGALAQLLCHCGAKGGTGHHLGDKGQIELGATRHNGVLVKWAPPQLDDFENIHGQWDKNVPHDAYVAMYFKTSRKTNGERRQRMASTGKGFRFGHSRRCEAEIDGQVGTEIISHDSVTRDLESAGNARPGSDR